MIDLGTVRPGSTIRIPFSSFDKDDGSSITMTNFLAADVLIYKDGGTTDRGTGGGITATTDFDGKTGKHLAIIDLADDATTNDFFKAGSEYLVAIDAVTVDAVTTGGWIARFRIGYPNAYFDTSIATLASQTSFTLTAGPAEDDALNGMVLLIHDKASAIQVTRVVVEDYTGSTKTVTLRAAPATTFTIAAGDNVSGIGFGVVDVTHWLGTACATPTVAGVPEVDLTHVAGATTNVAALATNVDAILTDTGTTLQGELDGIQADTEDIQSRIPDALSSGMIKSDVRLIMTLAPTVGASIDIPTQIASRTNITGGTITTVTNLTNAPTNGDLTATMKASVNAEADTAIADAALATAANLATVDTVVDAILDDTDDIGVAGAGLTALATQASVNTIDDFLDTEIAAIKAKTDNLPASPAAVGSAMTLATGAVSADALATDAVTEITDAILALVIETGLTLKNAMRVIAAAAAGKLSGAATTTVVVRNAAADSKDRITATVDADGNRSAITLDLT